MSRVRLTQYALIGNDENRLKLLQVTATSVVQAYIDRIKEVQPILNCVCEDRFDEALKEARKCDDLLASPNAPSSQVLAEKKPFFGVPFTTKVTSNFHKFPKSNSTDFFVLFFM